MTLSALKHPTAWIPLVMSLTALAIIAGHLLLFGTVHEADEGAAAHLFQLLMVFQAPLVALFVFKWLPKAPIQAMQVLGLQIAAIIAALAPVFYFKL